jgi:hypothetical protein
MAVTCTKHTFEVATDTCAECRAPACPDCLVYPHGPSSPALCIPCALALSGVRRSSTRKQRRSAAKARSDLAEARRAAARAQWKAPSETPARSSMAGRVTLGLVALAGLAAAAVPVLQAIR